jgi:WD repeat-containing protein 48
MKQRIRSAVEGRAKRMRGSWEIMTGWGDDVIEEEEDGDDRVGSDGDVLGDVVGSLERKRKMDAVIADDIPYEQQWETDMDAFVPSNVSLPIRLRSASPPHRVKSSLPNLGNAYNPTWSG